MKLFCAADLHLGRVPSRLPSELPVDRAELGPAAAWRTLVETCLHENADALLLAGDVVDDPRDLYEAYADLEEGARRLARAGIPVLAVAGNHDVRVLPRLAETIPGVRLLGDGGRWESATVGRGPNEVRVVGWSFPSEHVDASPLDDRLAAMVRAPGPSTTLGLLHADLGQPSSPYAPVRGSELSAIPVSAWLLGHVHVPGRFDEGARLGYLGSLSACDPGEAGRRGAWALTMDAGELRFEHRALSPLRYETVEVDLAGATPETVAPRLIRSVRARLADLVDATGGVAGEAHGDAHRDAHHLRLVAVRARLTGRVEHPDAVRAHLARQDPRELRVDHRGVHAIVHDVDVRLLPDVDLARLAQGSDPIGIVARTLQILRAGASPATSALVNEARPRLTQVRDRAAFAPLDASTPSDDELAERLEAAAARVLDHLLAQRAPETS